jgi:cytosine/adenosine deaminase-related metal-dependent hydrolase
MRRLFKIDYLYGRDGIEKDVCLIEESGSILQKLGKNDISGTFDAIYNLKGVVLPSFVNAHTHLELTTPVPPIPNQSLTHSPQSPILWDWIIEVVKTKRTWSDADFERHIRAGEKILLENGTGIAGDIRSVLPKAPCFFDQTLQGTVFYELLGYDENIFNTKWEAVLQFLQSPVTSHQSLKKGISIHSLYTTPFSKAKKILKIARENGLQIMMHLGETEYEDKLLFEGDMSGFKKIFPSVKFENNKFKNYSEVMEFLDMGKDCIIVHGVQFKDNDWEAVKKRDIAAVLCPRSNYFFAGKLPDARKVMDAGIRWAIGSDSLFTNIDLDVLAEAQFLYNAVGKTEAYGESILNALTYGGREMLNVPDDGISPSGNTNFVFFPGNISETTDIIKFVLDSDQKPIYCNGAADYGILEPFKK